MYNLIPRKEKMTDISKNATPELPPLKRVQDHFRATVLQHDLTMRQDLYLASIIGLLYRQAKKDFLKVTAVEGRDELNADSIIVPTAVPPSQMEAIAHAEKANKAYQSELVLAQMHAAVCEALSGLPESLVNDKVQNGLYLATHTPSLPAKGNHFESSFRHKLLLQTEIARVDSKIAMLISSSTRKDAFASFQFELPKEVQASIDRAYVAPKTNPPLPHEQKAHMRVTEQGLELQQQLFLKRKILHHAGAQLWSDASLGRVRKEISVTLEACRLKISQNIHF